MTDGKKILIAEDEKPLAKALALKFEKAGIDADIVNDGDALKEKLKEGGYALLLMDLMMPKHDGFAVIEQLKEEGNTMPVVVMSNLSQDTDRNRAAAAGAAHYFVKSDVGLGDIVTYIQDTLSK